MVQTRYRTTLNEGRLVIPGPTDGEGASRGDTLLYNRHDRDGRFGVFRSISMIAAGTQKKITHMCHSVLDVAGLSGLPLIPTPELGRREGRNRRNGYSVPRDGTGPFIVRKTVRRLGAKALDDVFYAVSVEDRHGPR